MCAGWVHYQLMPQNVVPRGISQIRCGPLSCKFLSQGSDLKSASNAAKIESLTQQVQKKLSCLRMSRFKLSLESCSPLTISLTVLPVARCVENKRTHFFMFITSFSFFTSFFQHAHNKCSLSYRRSFTKVHNKRTFFSPVVGNTAPFT